MTPLLSALKASCRGDWSKGVYERASGITFSPPTLPLAVPLPICAAPLDHSPPSTQTFVILLSPLTQEERAASMEHIPPVPHKLIISRFLLRVPTTQLSMKVNWKYNKWHLICFLNLPQPAEAQMHIYDVLCVDECHNLLNTFVLQSLHHVIPCLRMLIASCSLYRATACILL